MRPSRRPPFGLAAGAAILIGIIAIALAGAIGAPNPHAVDVERILEPPSRDHWLGTDGLGRDVAARLAEGARVSLAVGMLTAAVALAVGVPLGALAGWSGGWMDASVSRIVEAVLSVPTILVALAVLAAAPEGLRSLPETLRLAVVLGGLGWPTVARYVRAEVLRLAGSDVAASARAAGAGPLRIVARHILPAAIAPVSVGAAFTVGAAILAEAGLSFLGLGVPPPTASWGGMLAESRETLARAWWLVAFPGLALFATVLACNLAADGVRAAMDPRRRDG